MYLTRERLRSIDSTSHCEGGLHGSRLIHLKGTVTMWADSVGVVNDIKSCSPFQIESCPFCGIMYNWFDSEFPITIPVNGDITVCYGNFVIHTPFWVVFGLHVLDKRLKIVGCVESYAQIAIGVLRVA